VVRDFFHVDDLVDAALLAAVYDGPERVLNVGSGIGRSVRDVVASIDAIIGMNGARVICRPARAVDVPINVLDVSRIRRVLGWAPRTAWLDGLRDTADWLRLDGLAQAAAPGIAALAGRVA